MAKARYTEPLNVLVGKVMMRKLRERAGDGPLSDTVREVIWLGLQVDEVPKKQRVGK